MSKNTWKDGRIALSVAGRLARCMEGGGLRMSPTVAVMLEELVCLAVDRPFRSSDIVAALRGWTDSELPSFEAALFQARQERVARELENRGERTLVLPVEFELASIPEHPIRLTIFGLELEISSYDHVRSEISGLPASSEELVEYSEELRGLPRCVFRMKMEAESDDDAFRHLSDQFASFWGALEFEASRNRFSFISSQGTSAAELPHPTWFLLIGKGGVIGAKYFVVNKRSKVKVQVEDLAKTIQTIASRYPSELPSRKTTTRLVMDAVRLYAEALLQPLLSQRLLGFWQLAERIVLSEENSDTREVARRLLFLQEVASEKTPLQHALAHVAGLRNSLVHAGRQEGIDDIHVSLLKFICVVCMKWIIENTKSLPSEEHLSELFRMRTKADASLAATRSVADLIRSIRSSGPPGE